VGVGDEAGVLIAAKLVDTGGGDAGDGSGDGSDGAAERAGGPATRRAPERRANSMISLV
jgi:hypothetical protein